MSKFEEYLEKVQTNRMDEQGELGDYKLQPNQVEVIGTNKGGLNVHGSLGEYQMRELFNKFNKTLKEQNKQTSGPIVKQLFKAWLEKNHPDIWAEILKIGGFKKLLGNKFPPSDIIVTGTEDKKGIKITPDA